MAITRTVAPTEEVISVEDVKAHLRIDNDDENVLINSLIKAASNLCETITGRQFVTATWQLTLDQFPASDAILLPKPPAIAITSVAYVDTNGDSQTWAASNYTLDTASEPARLALAYNISWPTTRWQVNAVTVTWTAGYGTAINVPHTIKTAMKMLVGHWMEHREAATELQSVTEVPMAVESLLWSERVLEIV